MAPVQPSSFAISVQLQLAASWICSTVPFRVRDVLLLIDECYDMMQIRKEDGMPVLLDIYNRVNLDTYNYTLTLPHVDHLCFPSTSSGGTEIKVLCPNSHFIQVQRQSSPACP